MFYGTYSWDEELAMSPCQLTGVLMRWGNDRNLAKPLKPWTYLWERPEIPAAGWGRHLDIESEYKHWSTSH